MLISPINIGTLLLSPPSSRRDFGGQARFLVSKISAILQNEKSSDFSELFRRMQSTSQELNSGTLLLSPTNKERSDCSEIP